MRRIILILFIVISSSAISQVPGYMGKRFSVGYSNYFMGALIGPVANSTSSTDLTGINTVHCLNIEYSIKNRTNFCLSLQSLKTGIYSSQTFSEYGTDKYGNGISNSYSYSPLPFTPMQIKTLNAGIGFKFFQRGTLAPIGRYKKFEMLLMFSDLTYENNSFLIYQANNSFGTSDTYRGNKGAGEYKYTTIAFAFTMGRSRVLFDRIVLDYGLRFCFVPAALVGFFNDAEGTSDFETTLKQNTNLRLFREQLFNLHIGIGFLAF